MKYLEMRSALLSKLPLVYLERRYQKKAKPASFRIFNKHTLYGQLAHVDVRNKGVIFQLTGDKKEYIFYPVYDKDSGTDQLFHHFATAGDRIIKLAHSNILILRKQGTNYIYTFRKPMY
ncbi:hypothetical protein [Niabella beijingensis]|uniref:hypothetical protein n=1 Tax=Niabella beijingensis TaxID=2872700 RepID=UPI001CBB061A|nr:hypothetical protein [Niabella beijingensis]MBZ4190418.1 hypothetical protein [Niabella beijingensis]